MFSVVVLLIRHQSVPGPGPGSACQHDGILTAAVPSSPEITVSPHVRINSSSVRYHTYLLNILRYNPVSKRKRVTITGSPNPSTSMISLMSERGFSLKDLNYLMNILFVTI